MLCRVILLALDGVGPTGVPSVRSMTTFVTVQEIETSTQFSKILVPTFRGHPLVLIHRKNFISLTAQANAQPSETLATKCMAFSAPPDSSGLLQHLFEGG